MHHQAVTEHRDVVALARRARHLERNQVLAFRHRLLEHAIQALVLEEKDRVGVADRGQQQALRLVGARRDDDLQAWGRKAGLDRLRVIERPVRVAAHRCPHHERRRPVAVGAVAVLRDLVGDRVEGEMREVRELHLRHRSLTGDRQAERDTCDG